jgi:hypothetical protein
MTTDPRITPLLTGTIDDDTAAQVEVRGMLDAVATEDISLMMESDVSVLVGDITGVGTAITNIVSVTEDQYGEVATPSAGTLYIVVPNPD